MTLTYDEEHLPENMSVNKRDVQLFHKRLRKYFPPGDLRYYVVSEYGDHTFRPHYHGLYFLKGTYDKQFIYDTFTNAWQQGFLKFGEVQEGSIVYCTKYCLKHSQTPNGRLKTFRLVSKMNGGIGANYLTEMSSYHLENNQFKFVSYNGKTCRMPRYYRLQLGHQYDRFAQEDELYNTRLDDFRKRYADFTRLHKSLPSVEARQTAFIESERSRIMKQEELIEKHCKKQKL